MKYLDVDSSQVAYKYRNMQILKRLLIESSMNYRYETPLLIQILTFCK